MNCPLCDEKMPDSDLEEVWESFTCETCEDFEVHYWDHKIKEEIVYLRYNNVQYLREFKVVFDRGKNETALYEVFHSYHERDSSMDAVWTEHIITLPPIKNVPKMNDLIQMTKTWMTFL